MQGSVSANHLNNFSDRFSEQDERFRQQGGWYWNGHEKHSQGNLFILFIR
ncbi:unnamed protein product [Brassica oleracea var. botrytis]|uniref:Uncharacterized protein n=1 Tax=Brassica oleracea TaxID=3712 RepID=A0A3P6CPP4_BRAOL|nr:unnamed protein product [Brassica oleracea]